MYLIPFYRVFRHGIATEIELQKTGHFYVYCVIVYSLDVLQTVRFCVPSNFLPENKHQK